MKIIKNRKVHYYLGQSHDDEALYLAKSGKTYQLALCESNIEEKDAKVFYFDPKDGYDLYTYNKFKELFNDDARLSDNKLRKLCKLLKIIFIGNAAIEVNKKLGDYRDETIEGYYGILIDDIEDKINYLLS
jgi:hypothetical protein